ncbi:MAG: sigma-70 family RNA polymerase sigma factor [Myxococcales bacterium]|nr:sigma-70 family RNA polymerase sigma factor [Myxococcales bacterium]
MMMLAPTHDAHRSDFEATVLPLRPILYRRAIHLCRDTTQAEDLVQETVLRAWRFWPSFKRGTNCAAWLRTILTHSFITRCRKGGRERALTQAVREHAAAEEQLAHDPDPAQVGFADEVLKALGELPEEFSNVLVLVDVEGLSYRAAAQRLACPIGTVMSRLHRARRLMRTALSDYARVQGYA